MSTYARAAVLFLIFLALVALIGLLSPVIAPFLTLSLDAGGWEPGSRPLLLHAVPSSAISSLVTSSSANSSIVNNNVESLNGATHSSSSSSNQVCRWVTKPIPPVRFASNISALLQQEQMQVGAELGVRVGNFAAATLQVWTACKRYYLVDLWQHQANYAVPSNVPQEQQERAMQKAKNKLAPWQDKTVWLRNYTTQAVHDVHERHLDFVYVDARHDYCGTLADIETWWPKVRPGGIMAGHDFMPPEELAGHAQGNWSVCADGSVQPGAVYRAVTEFFGQRELQVVVTYGAKVSSVWLVRKPQLVCDAGVMHT